MFPHIPYVLKVFSLMLFIYKRIDGMVFEFYLFILLYRVSV